MSFTTAKSVLNLCGLGCALLASSGAYAANRFADVSLSGTLISGNAVSSVTKLGVGQYEVTFSSAVNNCAYIATTVNAYSQALNVFTAGGHLSANGVYVETKNQGGGLTDGPFNLVVNCGDPGMQYAVVGYSGELVRGTPGTTVSIRGTGKYNVIFPTPINTTCAFLATVGDPGNALVFSPSGVYTGHGPGTNTMYIETKNPGGGLQNGVPFHVAAICSTAPGTHISVVQASGIPKKGSGMTSSFNSSPGLYTIATNAPITPGCAIVATRGSIDHSVPFDPATIEIAPGPAENTTGIQVRSLLFFGGDLIDESFHAAAVCP
jgi:hypothetical protein